MLQWLLWDRKLHSPSDALSLISFQSQLLLRPHPPMVISGCIVFLSPCHQSRLHLVGWLAWKWVLSSAMHLNAVSRARPHLCHTHKRVATAILSIYLNTPNKQKRAAAAKNFNNQRLFKVTLYSTTQRPHRLAPLLTSYPCKKNHKPAMGIMHSNPHVDSTTISHHHSYHMRVDAAPVKSSNLPPPSEVNTSVYWTACSGQLMYGLNGPIWRSLTLWWIS